MRRLAPAAVCLCLSACGGSTAAPSGPAQVAGVWTGTLTATRITGGDCVGEVLPNILGVSSRFTATIQQSGSALTATVTDEGTGSNCTYAGTAGNNTLTLNVQTCQVGIIAGIHCATGELRDIQLVTGAITGTITGNTITGTETQTWNTFVSGTSVGVGTLVFSGRLTVSR